MMGISSFFFIVCEDLPVVIGEVRLVVGRVLIFRTMITI